MIREISIDCNDPNLVSSFWGKVLGWEPRQEEDWYWMAAPGADERRDLALVFARVPEKKLGKNRVHIDICPVGADQLEELQRLTSLGAVPVDVGQGDQSWVVLADPEGKRVLSVGETSRLSEASSARLLLCAALYGTPRGGAGL